nr:protein B0294.2 [imported] - Caenorhabditis elegans [Caenorhabditis elegans]
MFVPSDRIATFGGIANVAFNAKRRQELVLADGTCQRNERTMLDATRSVHFADTYICYCSQPLCNSPITIEDFENAGYKLPDQD